MEENSEQKPGERIVIWFLLLLSIFILIQALMIPHLENLSSSGVFPIFIALIMISSVLRILWKNRARYSALKIGAEFDMAIPLVFPRAVAIFATILTLYIFLLHPLHFWISSYLFLVGSFVFLKGAKILRALLIAAGLLVVIYFLFQYLFRVIFW
jgi:putative tricarboxylic transport membrane protein